MILSINRRQINQKCKLSYSAFLQTLNTFLQSFLIRILHNIKLKVMLEPITAPKVPQDFHVKLRERFFSALQAQQIAKIGQEKFLNSGCFFKGIPAVPKNYDDIDHIVQQESTFWYLYGVKEADCYALTTPSKQKDENGKYKSHTVLFVPKLDQAYRMWMFVKSQEQFLNDYKVQQVRFVDQMRQYFDQRKLSKIYLYYGVDSDSKSTPVLPDEKLYMNEGLEADKDVLWILISNLRVIKTEDELNIMRYVCKLATDAHITVIHNTKAGLLQQQMLALFEFEHCSKSGSKHTAFSGIASSGCDCATLHYIQNDKIVQPGQMCLHDMGGKFYGYCADQAITFPVDKKFTQKQREIYNAVQAAQRAVLENLKEGVEWMDMHLLAEKVIVEHLISIGIVKINGLLEQHWDKLKENRLGAVFFPHGLGHFLGLRTHDLGGYTAGPPRSTKAGLKSLRTLRKMQQNMVITVEPGCYFIDFIIENALNDPELSQYLCKEKIDQYREVGGVRLQDNVIVKKDGVQMLSKLPRKIEDLQKVMHDSLKK